jgi:hypothetical protein
MSLVTYEGALIAGGSHHRWEGSSLIQYDIGRWDGSAWTPVGGTWHDDPNPPPDYELAVYRGRLLASGNEGRPNIREWNGDDWIPFGGGTDDAVLCMLPTETSLYVAGRLTEAGGVPSRYVGRWTEEVTPVLLQDFRAEWQGEIAIALRWRLAAFDDIEHLAVERAPESGGPYSAISPALAPETEMLFVDSMPDDSDTVFYRFKATTRAGLVEILGPFSVSSRGGTSVHRLFPIHDTGPGAIAVRYALGSAHESYRLAVFDVRGRLVRDLAAGPTIAGHHTIHWNRDTQAGRPAARGAYWVQLRAGARTAAERVVLLHNAR